MIFSMNISTCPMGTRILLESISLPPPKNEECWALWNCWCHRGKLRFYVWEVGKEGREGNGKNEAANPTAGEPRGAGEVTQLPIPKPTAPFWDSNNSHFSSLSFLDRLWAPDKIVCLGLGAARQLLLPLAKSCMAQRGELGINIHLAPQGGPKHTGRAGPSK